MQPFTAQTPHPGTSAPKVVLQAQGIRKSFRMGDEDLVVLKHAELAVREGEFVAIEGRSGSGKSTLLHILGGLDAPDRGSVLYGERDLAQLAIASVGQLRFARTMARRLHVPGVEAVLSLAFLFSKADRELARIRNAQFGFVFQFYHLLPELSVLENTLLPAMAQRSVLNYYANRLALRQAAADILGQVGLGHRLRHKPNQLSGGERQRVAIARALMNQPRVLFADEPTGNLDDETGRQIMAVLEGLHQNRGQTIIMVTHDRTLAQEADRVLLLKDGKLEAV